MEKTIVNPVEGSTYSEAVRVQTDEYERIFISGAVAYDENGEVVGEESAGKQTRHVLEQIRDLISEFGGSINNVVRVRVYVTDLNEEDFETIHEVRDGFFDSAHYPASTLVEVGALVDEDLLIEIDAEAIIPESEWEVETVETSSS